MNPYRYGDDQFVGPPSPADINRLKKRQGQPFFMGPPAPDPNADQQPGVADQMAMYAAQQPPQPEAGAPPKLDFNPYRSLMTDPDGMTQQYQKMTDGMNMNAPGAHANLDRTAQQGLKQGSVRNFLRSPEELAVMEAMAQGQKVRQALDERNQPKFKIDEQTGERTPVYDITNEFDPSHPVQQEKQGLADLQEMARTVTAGRNPGVDYSPLAAFVDAQTGSHFANSYKAPNNEHMIDDAMSFAQKIQERRKDISNAINQEKQRMSGAGSLTDMTNLLIADKLGLGNRTPNPPSERGGSEQNRWNQWYGKLQGDKSLNAANDSNGYLTKALSMIKTNNPVAFFNSKVEVLRAMGIGSRVTNLELANEPGAQDFLSKWNQALETMTKGDWTPENQKKYVAMLTDLAQEQKKLVQSIHSYHRQSGIEGYGLDPGKVDRQLSARQKSPVFDIKPGAPEEDKKSVEMKKLMEDNKRIEDILKKAEGK